jgi:hypothetical protein
MTRRAEFRREVWESGLRASMRPVSEWAQDDDASRRFNREQGHALTLGQSWVQELTLTLVFAFTIAARWGHHTFERFCAILVRRISCSHHTSRSDCPETGEDDCIQRSRDVARFGLRRVARWPEATVKRRCTMDFDGERLTPEGVSNGRVVSSASDWEFATDRPSMAFCRESQCKLTRPQPGICRH